MKTQQKALIVKTAPERTHGLDELNVHLGRGWRVVHLAPMGGAGVGTQQGDAPALWLAALVILEREEEETVEVMEQVQEQSEEIIDEIVEGDGAGPELPDELEQGNGDGPPFNL